MSVYRTGEDKDGTRHYWAPRHGFDMTPTEFSLTREQRRRGNRRAAVLMAVVALLAAAGAWTGHALGHTTVATLFGAAGGVIAGAMAFLAVLPLVMCVFAIRDTRRQR